MFNSLGKSRDLNERKMKFKNQGYWSFLLAIINIQAITKERRYSFNAGHYCYEKHSF